MRFNLDPAKLILGGPPSSITLLFGACIWAALRVYWGERGYPEWVVGWGFWQSGPPGPAKGQTNFFRRSGRVGFMGGCAGPFPPRGWVAWRKVPYPAQGVAKKVYCPREYLVSSTKAERRKHGKIDGLAWNFCFENYADIVCLRAVNFLAKKVVLIICCPFFGCKTEDHVLYSSLFIYCFFLRQFSRESSVHNSKWKPLIITIQVLVWLQIWSILPQKSATEKRRGWGFRSRVEIRSTFPFVAFFLAKNHISSQLHLMRNLKKPSEMFSRNGDPFKFPNYYFSFS